MTLQLMKRKLADVGETDVVSAALRRHATLSTGIVQALDEEGRITVTLGPGANLRCLALHGVGPAPDFQAGDTVLVACSRGGRGEWSGIVLGRVGPVGDVARRLVLEAAESLSLKCGEAQIDLRADGKVLLKGEDVTVRAKGTQRIRAGTVAIN